MAESIIKQIQRIKLLSDMTNDCLDNYETDIKALKEYFKIENPKWYDYPSLHTTKEELKRLMLVQRQEMIRLDKMLSGFIQY